MEDTYLTKKSGINKLDTADNAEHQLFLKRFKNTEESANSKNLLYGDEKIIMPRK